MAGYSETPLVKKLGIKSGMTICILNAPVNYAATLGGLPDEVNHLKTPQKGKMDFIQIFCKDSAVFLKNYAKMKEALRPGGMLWISWPKKSSAVVSDLTENFIRNHALENGLVDVKVCAVDETWSGLKLVIRLKDR